MTYTTEQMDANLRARAALLAEIGRAAEGVDDDLVSLADEARRVNEAFRAMFVGGYFINNGKREQ